MDRRVAARIADLLGAPVRQVSAVHGGDNSAAHRVELGDGRVVFAKTHAAPPEGWFTTEATSLEWLREAHAVRVPQVLAASDGDDTAPAHLVMEWIEEGGRGAVDDVAFGRALADLHRAGAPSYGREDRRTTGSRRLPNDPCATWPEFYATRRLLPLAHLATQSGALSQDDVDKLRRVADRLDGFEGADERPARLHGDLWGGNRLVDTRGDSWLVDPAAHGGHREFDLATMRVFGGFSAQCFDAYAEVFPLAAGWEDRVELHQISTLVVHAIKFGGGYVRAAASAIARYA
jgi:fructosamine-3-kinase